MVTKTKTDMGLKEEIASMIWALSVSYAIPFRAGKVKWTPSDFAGQKLINKSPYYELANQIIQACIGELTERFNEWVKERIADCDIPPLSVNHARRLAERLETFRWVRLNFKRIVKEIQGE